MPKIREVDSKDVTLDAIKSAALELREAREALENSRLVTKAAKETVDAAQDRHDLLTGAKEELRPLLEGGEGE